jgi:hypothetical protein
MNGKTVEMRLTIFPATSHKTIHGFITIQVADLLRCSEPRWRLHIVILWGKDSSKYQVNRLLDKKTQVFVRVEFEL